MKRNPFGWTRSNGSLSVMFQLKVFRLRESDFKFAFLFRLHDVSPRSEFPRRIFSERWGKKTSHCSNTLSLSWFKGSFSRWTFRNQPKLLLFHRLSFRPDIFSVNQISLLAVEPVGLDKLLKRVSRTIHLKRWCQMTTAHLSLRLYNIKHHLYHVHRNPKHYSIIFAIILQFDKACSQNVNSKERMKRATICLGLEGE